MKKIEKVDIPGAETLTAAQLNGIVIESELHSRMQGADRIPSATSSSQREPSGATSGKNPHSLSSLKDLRES